MAALQDAMAHVRALQLIANAEPRPTGANYDCRELVEVAHHHEVLNRAPPGISMSDDSLEMGATMPA
jgi:hypothetical protein